MPNAFTKHLPNAVTSCNLLSGCVAMVMAFQHQYQTAFLFILLGAVFDFCDGLTARALKAYSPIGKELDSLADVVTFGLAPSVMIFSLLQELQALLGASPYACFVPYMAFLIAVFSALRLAKFNVDERQTTSFIGLPTPANALFWGSLIVGGHPFLCTRPACLWGILVLVFLFSWLLVAEMPMFSLKFKNLKWQNNKIRFLFLAISLFLLIFLGISGFAASIGWYILLSVLTGKRA